MIVKIELDTGDAGDLAALIALIGSLGGSVAPTVVARPAPPPPTAKAEPSTDLIAQEAARVAALADTSGDDDAGEAADPASLDANGIPWDARIHASTKGQNKDKTWKKLRNVNEVLYGEVFAELQEKHAPNAGTGTGSTGSAQSAGNSATTQTVAAEAPNAPVDTASAAAGATIASEAPPPPASGARFADFPAFVQAVNAIRSPAIPYLELNGIASGLGVAAFKDMKDRADMWEMFFDMAGGQ